MFKRVALLAVVASIMSVASQAQVAIRIGPPPPVVEHYGPPPRPGWVWVGGFHRWDGARYVWTPGHYAAPLGPVSGGSPMAMTTGVDGTTTGMVIGVNQ
jgi:hypothetical protein